MEIVICKGVSFERCICRNSVVHHSMQADICDGKTIVSKIDKIFSEFLLVFWSGGVGPPFMLGKIYKFLHRYQEFVESDGSRTIVLGSDLKGSPSIVRIAKSTGRFFPPIGKNELYRKVTFFCDFVDTIKIQYTPGWDVHFF